MVAKNSDVILEARRIGAIVFTADEVYEGWFEYRSRGPVVSYSHKPIETCEGYDDPKDAERVHRHEQAYAAKMRDRAEQRHAQWEHYERWRWIRRSWKRSSRQGPPVPFAAWYESNPLLWFQDRYGYDVPKLDWGGGMTFPQILEQPECRDLNIKTLHTWRARGQLVHWNHDGKWHTNIGYVKACQERVKVMGGKREGAGRKNAA